MCDDAMLMRMSDLEEELLEMLEAEASKGLMNVNAADMGEVVDMLKDLEEAKYYCSIVAAMHEDDGPMGYNPRRYASGRYAPKGRGMMGYEPMHFEEPYVEPWDGMENRMMTDRRGTAYDRYKTARMGYQKSRTAENRRGMDDAANEHLREFTESMGEMWSEADQGQKSQIHEALVKFVNGLK